MPRDPRDRFAQMDAIRAALRRGETPSVSLPDDAMRPEMRRERLPDGSERAIPVDPRPMNLRGRIYNQTIMDELMNSVVLDESVADGHMRMMNSMRAVAGTVGAASAGFAQMNAAAQQMLHNNGAQDALVQRMEQDRARVEREYRRALERQLMQDNNSQAVPPGLLGLQPLSRGEVERRYPSQSVHRRPGMQRLEPWNGADVLSFPTRRNDDVVDSMAIGRIPLASGYMYAPEGPEAFIDIEPHEEPNAPSA